MTMRDARFREFVCSSSGRSSVLRYGLNAEKEMHDSDRCHLKLSLISIANDLYIANTSEKINKSICQQRIIWKKLQDNHILSCNKCVDIAKFADFVVFSLQRAAPPDDLHIFDLVGINLRVSALLTDHCPCHQQMPPDSRLCPIAGTDEFLH